MESDGNDVFNIEMKVIMFISEFVRELNEKKDYESSVYKLAATLVNLISYRDVNEHHNLLIGLLEKLEKDYEIVLSDKNKIVNDYLKKTI